MLGLSEQAGCKGENGGAEETYRPLGVGRKAREARIFISGPTVLLEGVG